jgi:putative phage-type endonuclease
MALTPLQKSERRLGLGASMAAPACGLSKYKTPYKLWREMALGEDLDEGEKLHLDMGHVLEPFTLDRFARTQKKTVIDRQVKVVDPKHPWRWVTLDGRCQEDRAPIEAKSVGFANPAEWGEEFEADAVPMEYYAQCQHNMACTDASYVWFPVIVLNRQFRVYKIHRDQGVIDHMTNVQTQFLEMVRNKTPPPPQTMDDVSTMFPGNNGALAKADEATRSLVVEMKAKKADIKIMEEATEELKLQIAAYMGDSTELLYNGRLITTYRRAKDSKKFDINTFMVDHPAMYDKYLIPVPGSRRMLLK